MKIKARRDSHNQFYCKNISNFLTWNMFEHYNELLKKAANVIYVITVIIIIDNYLLRP